MGFESPASQMMRYRKEFPFVVLFKRVKAARRAGVTMAHRWGYDRNNRKVVYTWARVKDDMHVAHGFKDEVEARALHLLWPDAELRFPKPVGQGAQDAETC